MNFFKSALLVMILIFLCGCATVPISEGAVYKGIQIFYSIPKREYEDLGIISAQPVLFGPVGAEGAIASLASKAKNMDADALIDVRITSSGSGYNYTASGRAVKWIREKE